MLKALFLDLDETLCDTTGANKKALEVMANKFTELFPDNGNTNFFAEAYLKGIYRELDERYTKLLLPINDEEVFRLDLITLILTDMNIKSASFEMIKTLQNSFDEARTHTFDFFPKIKDLLLELRKQFTLVVITNGPEFSQLAKIKAVNLQNHVDFIIIGGQEKEQKPAVSIFEKALTLSKCRKEEVMHIGDSLKADVLGANNSGITSVWISHGNKLDESLGIIPTYIVETPFSIRELIKSIGALPPP